MFRSSLLAAAVAVLVPTLASAQAGAALAKQLEANERAVNEAVAKNDAAGFSKLVAADGLSLDGNGLVPVSEFLKMISQVKVSNYALDQFKITPVSDTTSIVTYRWTGKGTFAGQPFPSPVYASSVWINKGGKWTNVFHQESTANPAPPAAKK